jgi:hypothetical protein
MQELFAQRLFAVTASAFVGRLLGLLLLPLFGFRR